MSFSVSNKEWDKLTAAASQDRFPLGTAPSKTGHEVTLKF